MAQRDQENPKAPKYAEWLKTFGDKAGGTSTENTVALRGFLGPGGGSGKEQRVRLYLGVDLARYLDILWEDVVEQVELEGSDKLGGSALWVNKDALVRYTREIEAEFVSDWLRQEYGDGGDEYGGDVGDPSDTTTANRKCS